MKSRNSTNGVGLAVSPRRQNWQNSGMMLMGQVKGLNRSVRAGRKQARDEKVEFGRCQSSFKSYLGTESEYGNRHINCQTEVQHESTVAQTQAYTTLHKMRLGYRSLCT